MKYLKNINDIFEKNEIEEIDNFTARYYDLFDDEEEPANEKDLINFNERNKKIQMFEEYIKK